MTGFPERTSPTTTCGPGRGVEATVAPPALRSDGGSRDTTENVEKRHRILRTLCEQLERHPAIVNAQGIPEGKFAEVRAEIDTASIGREAARATVRVTWHPTPTFPPGISIEDRERTSRTVNFAFHYSESSGFDCGWHLEPNPHVSGHLHYQERDAPDAEYSHQEFTLTAASPVGVLWELLDALDARLRDETNRCE